MKTSALCDGPWTPRWQSPLSSPPGDRSGDMGPQAPLCPAHHNQLGSRDSCSHKTGSHAASGPSLSVGDFRFQQRLSLLTPGSFDDPAVNKQAGWDDRDSGPLNQGEGKYEASIPECQLHSGQGMGIPPNKHHIWGTECSGCHLLGPVSARGQGSWTPILAPSPAPKHTVLCSFFPLGRQGRENTGERPELTVTGHR